jgi:S-disulfanyl-L-cysteine oxidoreductase SoxD
MRDVRVAALAALLLISAFAQAHDAPLGLGRAPTPAELGDRMISASPDGTGLPKAKGSVRAGRSIYNAQCAGCHGMQGEGVGDFPPLVGGRESLKTDQPLYTVGSYWPYATTVWDYINRAMPYQAPGTMTPEEVYAVTAYVLFLNGIVRESRVLDEKSLPRIRMPNRDGFVEDPRPDVPAPSSTLTQASIP